MNLRDNPHLISFRAFDSLRPGVGPASTISNARANSQFVAFRLCFGALEKLIICLDKAAVLSVALLLFAASRVISASETPPNGDAGKKAIVIISVKEVAAQIGRECTFFGYVSKQVVAGNGDVYLDFVDHSSKQSVTVIVPAKLVGKTAAKHELIGGSFGVTGTPYLRNGAPTITLSNPDDMISIELHF